MSKNYSLSDENNLKGRQSKAGITKWFRPTVSPQDIRSLMQKSDAIALRDTSMWFGIMLLAATLAVSLWPSWWSLPFWLAYGVLYGSAADARWHECGHGTAFKTNWMNDVIYQIASFMMMRNPVTWRASHIRHHTDTIMVGCDPEIVAMRPPDLVQIALKFVGIVEAFEALQRMLLHASGRIHPDESTYVRDVDFKKVFLIARIWTAIYTGTILLVILSGSILPLMLIGLPRLYGAWHHIMTGLLQHLGLAENVSDHRLNTRTVMMNPISRFIYLNMNYHIEHHMFTMVPYYNLPKLHGLIKHDLPVPEPSIFIAFQRLLPVLFKQLKYEDAVIIQDLPLGAAPYGTEVEILRPNAV